MTGFWNIEKSAQGTVISEHFRLIEWDEIATAMKQGLQEHRTWIVNHVS